MSEEKKITLTSIEDAWKLAKENGYEGSLEDFDAMCKNAAEKFQAEQMDLDSMDAVAGGGAGEVFESIGNWCSDHKEMLIGITSGLTAAAAGFAIYKYAKGKSNTSGSAVLDNISETSSIPSLKMVDW